MGEIEKRYFLCHNGIGGCWQLCGMVAHVDVETGEVLKIEGNVDHPMNRGRVFCPERVSNMMKLLRHPDQLMYPLKRVGERGENKWQRVSWDQALDEIGEKLKQLIAKHGPECLALTEGTYRSDTYWARTRFLNLIGNPFNEVGSGTQCTCNEVQLHIATAGTFILPDPPNANCIVLQGTGGKESHPANWAAVEVRMKQKPRVKTIAIDPRSTETTRHADIWLQIRPGTDGALYMCWLNIIIREGLYDEEFVKKWSNAPFLVRMDTRRILRESHLKAQGSPEKYAVWDVRSNNIAIWDSETRRFTAGTTDVALKGSCKVRMLDGREVECKPAW
ncbi:MAG: molybdopterin-dependent oxidoreductase, partial [Candidatus Bathyarchaeia archaeon]